MRNAVLIIGTVGIAAVVILTAAALSVIVLSPACPAPAPRQTGPATTVYNGHMFDCTQIGQLVSEGQWYTPDGSSIAAVLLADCDL